MTGTTLSRGNVLNQFILQPTLTPTSATATAGGAEQSFTVIGLLLGDVVSVTSNVANTNGVGIANARVSATNTLKIKFSVGGTVSKKPAAGVYNVVVIRPEGTPPTADA